MDFLSKVLPWIGAAATGGVPALVGMAAKTVGDVLGVSVSDPGKLAEAVANATPEQMLALKQAENEFAEKMQSMGFAHAEEMAKIGLQEDALVIDDVRDARSHNADNKQLWVIAWLILVTFAICMGMVLYGCYVILSGGITIKDVAVVAAVAGLIGSIVGYVAANAQTVINFLFGGSLGSRNNAQALSASVQQSIQQLGSK